MDKEDIFVTKKKYIDVFIPKHQSEFNDDGSNIETITMEEFHKRYGIPMFTQEKIKGISRSTLSEEYKPLINHKEKIDLIIK